mmetsp:Transcript_6682/g.11689  ORF Transcript_6682/g.11689 Transcript_6682/m.11689 type:complete len:980 (-) Transcript_6682:159-3098(-)
MMLGKDPWSTVRFASVFVAWGIITLSYYSFHHYVHHRHFHFTPHGNATSDGKGSGETHVEHAQRMLLEGHEEAGGNKDFVVGGPGVQKGHGGHEEVGHENGGGHEEHHGSSAHGGHGQHGGFDNFNGKDNIFFYGLAVPLMLLTVAGLIWNKNQLGCSHNNTSKKISRDTNLKSISDLKFSDTSSDTSSSSSSGSGSDNGSADGDNDDSTQDTAFSDPAPLAKARSWLARKNNNGGDVNVKKWTIIWFLVPMFLIIFDGMRSRSILHASADQKQRGWGLYIRICMSLLSPSGYAAAWPLALFLIPVTKHSPILDWLRVTPVQALGFHRICGWTSFWWSCTHGFLHLQHLMEVGNSQHIRTPMQQFKYLLIPEEIGQCFVTQNPWRVFWGEQVPYLGTEENSRQCWLALVNGTGMVSCIAFAILAITSIPSFRRNFYTLFYVIHIPMAWIMLTTAIWHYPMCVVLLVPNIIYYLSFNIPVCATQGVERKWRKDRDNKKMGQGQDNKDNCSALVEVNLIEGGSIELTFATTQEEQRHENCYVRVFCPGASAVSHPFSIFSRNDLRSNDENEGSISLTTRSILLRSKGPFTEALTKALFPNRAAAAGDADSLISISPSSESLPSKHHMIQFDSFYAGSFDWVDRAMESHDKIMILAGGVGIVPFLEFLPALQRRIEAAGQYDGPESIHLHWYCREVGLASHVLDNYLKPHVREAWESNPVCHGRLKIHVHLTKSSGGEDALKNISNSGLVDKCRYATGDGESQQAAVHLVQDARFTQSPSLRLLLPGFLMVAGTLWHWWWYKQFITAESFRRSNFIMRSNSIIFSLVLAVVVSVLVEVYFRYYQNKAGYSLVNGTQEDTATSDDGTSTEQKKEVQEQGSVIKMVTSDGAETLELETAVPTEANLISLASSYDYASTTTNMASSGFLEVSGGRPSVDTVIQDIIKAKQPGVYSCGPRTLLDIVERSIRQKRDDCAFYEEDSEM